MLNHNLKVLSMKQAHILEVIIHKYFLCVIKISVMGISSRNWKQIKHN